MRFRGLRVSTHPIILSLNIIGSSPGSRAIAAAIPCFKRFRRERFLPTRVLGPVLFLALRPLAAILAEEAISSPICCQEKSFQYQRQSEAGERHRPARTALIRS